MRRYSDSIPATTRLCVQARIVWYFVRAGIRLAQRMRAVDLCWGDKATLDYRMNIQLGDDSSKVIHVDFAKGVRR